MVPGAFGWLAEIPAEPGSSRQREQQEQLLLKAQEELQKAAQLAKTATERRVGAPEPAAAATGRAAGAPKHRLGASWVNS
eukprot:s2372_g7.t1